MQRENKTLSYSFSFSFSFSQMSQTGCFWSVPQILKENGAKEVFIFGSLANGKFNENSDIDIAVKGMNDYVCLKSIIKDKKQKIIVADCGCGIPVETHK